MPAVRSLKKRADFLRLTHHGKKAAAKGLVLQVSSTPENQRKSRPSIRVGYTVTRRVGNAVTRNRVKRRLRAVVQKLLTLHARADHDYVIIGRLPAYDRPFIGLQKDMAYALHQTGCYVRKA